MGENSKVLSYCFVLHFLLCTVEVETILVVEVVVMEEGVVLRRGSLVPCPFGGEEYCGVGDPFGPNLHQQFGAHLVEGFTVRSHLWSGANENTCPLHRKSKSRRYDFKLSFLFPII
jgi:hypothetical protein